jgi:hypothetical protein
LDQLQNELEAQYPNLDIQLVGVNAFGQDAGIPGATENHDIPLLQDVDANGNGMGDVWSLWNVEWRDVVILDANNQRVGVYNLTSHDLANAANFSTLKEMLLDAAQPTRETGNVAGFVYFDTDNDGVRDVAESPISNVAIVLAGTDTQGQSVNRSTRTGSDGSYRFDLVPTGTYTISQTQPAMVLDGRETIGSANGSMSNDQFVITLGANVSAENYNFGERGRTPAGISLLDFFASSSRDGAVVVAESGNTLGWYALEGGWSNSASVALRVTPTSAIHVSIQDRQGHNWSGDYNLGNLSQVQHLNRQDNRQLVRVMGPLLNVASTDPVASLVSRADAEGEAVPVAVTPPLIAAPDVIPGNPPSRVQVAPEEKRLDSDLVDAALEDAELLK